MNENFEHLLQTRNIKPTAMRLLVYDQLRRHKKALSLIDIEQLFNKVDRSTIFRTLKLFQKNGIIHSIDDGTGSIKYALCDEGCTCRGEDLHVHFLCIKCTQTFCLRHIPIPLINLPDSFNFTEANFVVKGVCSDCI